MKKLKKLMFAIVMLAVFGGVSFADDANAVFKWRNFEFNCPISNASAIALYDLSTGRGLMGAETKLVTYKLINLNFGAVTSFEANGMPFASIDFNFGGVIENINDTDLARIGLWAGRDFKENNNRFGVKASVPIW